MRSLLHLTNYTLRIMTTFSPTPGTVYIVGAGPGAPDLIAVRGRDIIEQADLILYADSLVELSVASLAKKDDAEIIPSSGLHLQQMVDLMVDAARAGKVVARVHSGDPALYGATHEQMALLDDAKVPYVIVPGITAAFAAAAELGVELTIPDLVQTIILTRTAGRTTMPEGEHLQGLAAPGASLAIYLSITRIKKVIEDLIASGGYTADTPVAVFHKVTWPDESYVVGTLADIAAKVRKAGYTKHALILVSPALDPELKGKDRRTSSHLYDASYTHRFRKAEDKQRSKEQHEAAGAVKGVVQGEKHLGNQRSGTLVLSVTRNGSALAATLSRSLEATAQLPTKFVVEGCGTYTGSVIDAIRKNWNTFANFVLVMPSGVATRAIAPLLRDKVSDPAVVCLDEQGQFVIPLVGGHRAGANALASEIAKLTKGHAAITTASDVQDKPAIDMLGADQRWKLSADSATTHVSACLVNEDQIGVYIDPILGDQTDVLGDLLAQPNVLTVPNLDELDIDTYIGGVIVTPCVISDHHKHLLRKSTLYRPATLVAGMGCKRDVPLADLQAALETTLTDNGFVIDSVATLASVDLKADEVGLIALAEKLGVSFECVPSSEIAAVDATGLSASAATEKLDLPGVSEPAALIVSNGDLIVKKQSFTNCTVALAVSRQPSAIS